MNKLVQAIAKQAKKARFASFVYVNANKEKARYKIQLGCSYKNLIEKSMLDLEIESQNMPDETREVANKLMESFRKTLNNDNQDYTKREVYKPITDQQGNVISGLKYNHKDNTVQIFGVLRTKMVLENPEKLQKRKPSIRSVLRDSLPIGRFREFNLENVKVAKIDGDTLVLE